MSMNWDDVKKVLSPIKDYEDLCSRFRTAYSYPFICETFNLTLPELIEYTRRLLGGDSRGRYAQYLELLVGIIHELSQVGVINIMDLVERTNSRTAIEQFSDNSSIPPEHTIQVLKYLVYWLVPMEKYLSGLVQGESTSKDTIQAFRSAGVRTNLDLLQQGGTPAGRKALSGTTGLAESTVTEWVNRADFSRLPWASKATIANIMGAGYSSMNMLASAEPERLFADFFSYGQSIGKNLKLGNEIENSYRIAKIVPVLVR